MFQTLPSTPTRTLTRGRGNRISGKADGSSGVGRSKSFLPQVRSNSFSRERQRLGDKRSLKQQIHEITGIADSALQGAPLSQFSVDERLSWIERRQTKLEEDKAYSLLGIFDVSMPLIYSEGRERAFKRLRKEIDSITADIAQQGTGNAGRDTYVVLARQGKHEEAEAMHWRALKAREKAQGRKKGTGEKENWGQLDSGKQSINQNTYFSYMTSRYQEAIYSPHSTAQKAKMSSTTTSYPDNKWYSFLLPANEPQTPVAIYDAPLRRPLFHYAKAR
jgi:hypothetical protein